MIRLIIFILFLDSIVSLEIGCIPNSTIDSKSAGYPAPFYFPVNWNESLPIPIYKTNQNCKWTVKIPDQKYAFFTMIANISDDSVLTISDCNGKSETVMTSDLQPYIFVGVQFTISLRVGATTCAFAFKIEWNDVPTPNPSFYSVNKTSPALFIDEMLTNNSVTFTAETMVSLVAFPSEIPDLTSFLRLTLVFDGPNTTSPYLGNLFQAVHSSRPMVSSSSQMTVYSFQSGYLAEFVIQDYYNVQHLAGTKGITCWNQSSCLVTLDARGGPVSAMSSNENNEVDYLEKLNISPGSVLKVYIGARREDDDSNLIATYNLEQSIANIPQKLNGYLLTYYLENGTALLELTEDSNSTKWADAAVGREGFITSRQFGYLKTEQDILESIEGSEPTQSFNFLVNITYLDVSNGENLTISFGRETGNEDFVFSKYEKPQNIVFTANGWKMDVAYVTNGTLSRGFHLDFQIDALRTSSANEYRIFVVILTLFASLG